MLTMFSGKRQWQRVVDAAACEKRRRDELDEDDIAITDKTRLLSSELPGFDESLSDACTNVCMDQARSEDEIAPQIAWRQDAVSVEPRFSSVEPNNFDRFEQVHIVESTHPFCPIRKPSRHASWQGLKQLVKKQFMPPFPFRKGMPLEEMLHLRQRQMEGAMNKTSRVLGASTNLVELRKLDAKIQNSMNKSVFVASAKGGGKSKENLAWDHDQNSEISKAVSLSSRSESPLHVGVHAELIKTKSSKDGIMPSSLAKENGILKKLKCQGRKDDVLLLAK